MKNNFRGKIREFIASEEGKVSVKAPLTVGIATGSVLFAQAAIAPAHNGWECKWDWQCHHPPHKCSVGTCVGG